MFEEFELKTVLTGMIGNYYEFPIESDLNILSRQGMIMLRDKLIDLLADKMGTHKAFDANDPIYSMLDHLQFYFNYEMSNELVNSDGKLLKRLAKHLKTECNVTLTNAELGILGGILTNYLPRDSMFFDVTDVFNWKSGDYGDNGSCYWTCRSDARDALMEHGAIALRIYSDKNHNRGSGRCWLYYLPQHKAYILFNAYGPMQLEELSNKLVNYLNNTGLTVYSKQIGFNINRESSGLIWINQGYGIIISEIDYSKLTKINVSGFAWSCENENNEIECCGCGIDHDEDVGTYIDGEFYCNECYFYCECCENDVPGDDYRCVDNYGYVCDYCLRHHFTECRHCSEYFHNDNIVTTDDDMDLCQNCYDNHTYECYQCNSVFYSIYHANGVGHVYYCDSCYEDYQNENEESIETCESNGN